MSEPPRVASSAQCSHAGVLNCTVTRSGAMASRMSSLNFSLSPLRACRMPFGPSKKKSGVVPANHQVKRRPLCCELVCDKGAFFCEFGVFSLNKTRRNSLKSRSSFAILGHFVNSPCFPGEALQKQRRTFSANQFANWPFVCCGGLPERLL